MREAQNRYQQAVPIFRHDLLYKHIDNWPTYQPTFTSHLPAPSDRSIRRLRLFTFTEVFSDKTGALFIDFTFSLTRNNIILAFYIPSIVHFHTPPILLMFNWSSLFVFNLHTAFKNFRPTIPSSLEVTIRSSTPGFIANMLKY